jgi:hypothetical protein
MLSAMAVHWLILGVIFIGLGGLVGGIAGVAFPDGQRMGALFALISGVGVGIVTYASAALLSADYTPSEFEFFGASLLGFLTVCAAVWALRRRTAGRS